MGSIQKRANGRYRARYRDPEGKEHARHFTRRIDAQQWLAAQVHKVTEGTWVDPSAGRRSFESYAREWLGSQVHHRASTTKITTYRLEHHLLPHFGDRPLVGIKRSEVQAWVRSLDLAPSTVEALYRLLAQIMLAAVEDHLLSSSPCRKINLPQRDRKRPTIPTAEQIGRIVESASDHGRAAVILAAGTGLRISELLGLTVDRVDFLRGVVTVDRQITGSTAGEPRFGPPKTKASTREVPVPLDLVEVVSAHLAQHPADELIFRTAAGYPWSRGSFGDEWRRWCSAAGESVRFHDLRHFYASGLIAAGQSVKVVQQRLGHASATVTLDTYGHLWPDDEDRTREAVSGLVAEISRTDRGLPARKPWSEAH